MVKEINAQISINILNYNTYDKSRLCIDSCLKQKGISFVILLIDNKSTDGSFERLKDEYGDKITFLQNEDNYGFAKGNNLGVIYCYNHGINYSFLLNSDTELDGDDLLYKMMKTITTVENCAIVAPKIYTITHKGNLLQENDSYYLKMLRFCRVIPPIQDVNDGVRTLSVAHGSALLVDNKKFIEIGGFPEHYFMYNEELTLAKKIMWNNYLICQSEHDGGLVLHHHDKTRAVEPWRFFLMGRNLSLEFWENRKGHPSVWFFVYYLHYLKKWIDGILHLDFSYFNGLKEGKRLHMKKATHEDCFKAAKSVRDNYK